MNCDPSNRNSPIKTGLLRIVAFFIVGYVAAVSADKLIKQILRKAHTGEYGVWNEIVAGEINAPILISGSSRALSHYDPRIFEEKLGMDSYNIALNASRIDLQLARLKVYLAHNSPPKLLIHNLDTHSLALSRDLYDPGQFMPYLGEKELYKALLAIEPRAKKWKNIPLYGYAVEDIRYSWFYHCLEVIGVGNRARRIDGFEPRDQSWDTSFDTFRSRNPDGVMIDFEPEGVKAQKDFIALCQKEGIQIVLVYSPEYFEMVPLAKNRETIFASFMQLSSDAGIPLIDYSDSEIGKTTDNFQNSQHLNAIGSEVFSHDLVVKLISLGIVEAAGQL